MQDQELVVECCHPHAVLLFVFSDDLREALGLDESQLPVYIYKMRALGYPPGWMEEAKLAPVLSMFNENGEGNFDIFTHCNFQGFFFLQKLGRGPSLSFWEISR